MSSIETKKVLIGSAVNECKNYIIVDFLKHLNRLTYKPFDIYLCDNTRTDDFSKRILYEAEKIGINLMLDRDAWCSDFRGRMVTTHNKLRERALKGGYDYLFVLDCDMLPPPDIIERLMAHDKDVVSGVYKLDMGSQGIVNCCWKERSEFKNGVFHPRWLEDNELNKGLVEWLGGIPTGCLLLKREVLEDTVFRHAGWLQDSVFFYDIRNAGYKIYVDTDIMLEHKYGSWDDVRDKDIAELKSIRGDRFNEKLYNREFDKVFGTFK